jgi:CSLREA domain-containing protein
VVADFDRDGDEDAVSAWSSFGYGEIAFHRNDGSGDFTTSILTSSFNSIEDLAAADVDGDGDDDLIVAGGALEWFENTDGQATFSATANVIFPANGTTTLLSVRAADLDEDGDLDVVAGGNDLVATPILSWWENGPAGWTQRSFPAPGYSEFVALAVWDLNRDGDLDVVTTGFDPYFSPVEPLTSSIVWFTGDAQSAPAQFVAQPAIPALAGIGPVEIVPGSQPVLGTFPLIPADQQADTTGLLQSDGDPDLVTGAPSAYEYRENRLDEATADFSPGLSLFFAQSGAFSFQLTHGLTVNDLNSDGRSDIFFGIDFTPVSPGFAGWGAFGTGVGTGAGILPTGGIPRDAAAADLNDDGTIDHIVAEDTLTRLFNQTFQATIAAAAPDGFATEGELKELQALSVTLHARPGDTTGRVETFDLQFVDTSPTPLPLTSAEANALIDRLHVYRNATPCIPSLLGFSTTCEDRFDPEDILLATIDELDLDTEGMQTLAIPGDDPNGLVASPVTFFVVAELADEGANQPLRNFSVRYRENSFVIRDALSGAPLLAPGAQTDFSDPISISAKIDVTRDGADANPGDGVCDDGTGNCTLRAAIQEANLRPGDDQIVLESGVYELTLPGSGEDGGATGDLDVAVGERVEVVGAGPQGTVIDASGLDRVFDVAGRLTLRDLTITGGSVAGPLPDGLGGAIRLRGPVANLDNCSILDSTATAGGGIGSDAGSLEIEETLISGNVAAERGGGVYVAAGGVVVARSTISGNTAAGHAGLSVGNGPGSTPQVLSSTISGNTAVGTPVPPAGTNCCEGGNDPAGCNDATCEATVCGIDPYCCDTAWDATCEGIAATYCGCPAIEVSGTGGGVGSERDMTLNDSTVTGNFAELDGGLSVLGQLNISNTIVAGNQAGANPDCGAYYSPFSAPAYNLLQDATGCRGVTTDASNVLGEDPKLGPLQNNGGPTPTHALLEESPAIDAGFCPNSRGTDQRLFSRTDLANVPNRGTSDGCDIGAYEFGLADSLPLIEVPVRWCVVEGAASFDFNSPTVQADVNAALVERHELANENVFRPQARVRFRSAANANIPNFPIIPDIDTTIGGEGDVVIDPSTGAYDEFLRLIASCRDAWQALDPLIVGITAVQINRFVGPDGNPIDVQGVGGRAEFGDVAMQMEAGRVMVVDRVFRRDPFANPDDVIDRLLAHELGHAAGGLRHGDGIDNFGSGFAQCGNGIIDDDDERCVGRARFDGANLMQYRRGTSLTSQQILLMREHIEQTIPDLQTEVTTVSETDTAEIDEERFNIYDFEFFNIYDFERFNIYDFELFNIYDFERFNIYDFEFMNIFDFGMDFTVDDPQTGSGEATVYASVGGLPWPTPIRPPTTYFWYLDLDEDPALPGSGDATGATPVEYGFAGSDSGDPGVDVIVQLDLYSNCDETTFVCSDFALKTVLVWDETAGAYVIDYGPEPADDAVSPITLGLVQSSADPEAEDPQAGMLLAPSFPLSVLVDAGVGYWPGDPITIEVVAAIPCELTLPEGTALDCQCLDCADCPDYPGCDTAAATPAAQKVCSDGETPCAETGQCAAGETCGGGKTCSVGGNDCVSNADCTAGTTDVCGSLAFLPADSPSAQLSFEAPLLPSCVVDPAVAPPGNTVTVIASDFPVATGGQLRVLIGGQEIGGGLPDSTGGALLDATIPSDTLSGKTELLVALDGVAATAACALTVDANAVPAEVDEISAPVDPLSLGGQVVVEAEFTDSPGDTHDAVWDWGDGTTSPGTIVEPAGATPGTVTGEHSYTEAGVYTVQLTVTDGTGNVSVKTFKYIVVFDPDGGFVTGGGFIVSPPDSFVESPALVGKAHFGFVAKYLPGDSVPTGNANFDFKVGQLKFKATAFDWLVINGSEALFQGYGTIHDEGSYGFRITAIDEAHSQSIEIDRFRIEIWNTDDGTVIYDNGAPDAGGADTVTPIEGGSIVIHGN